MSPGTRSVGLLSLIIGLSLGLVPDRASGQVSDAVKDRVAQLTAKLGYDQPGVADAAEKSLIGLGPRIIPLLDESDKDVKPHVKARIDRVREALSKVSAEPNLGASKVTIQAKGMRLSEALQALQLGTGNTINDLREQTGDGGTNPAMDLDLVDRPFFEALDLIAEKAGVTITTFTGDGSIGIMGGGDSGGPMMARPIVVYSGPFRIQLKQVAAVREFSNPIGTANVQFEVSWEPRLRPMLLSLKADALRVVADNDKAVVPAVSDESGDVVIRPENPAVELNLNLNAPDREARSLKSIKVKADLTLPAGLKTFRFKSLEDKNVTQTSGEIAVTLNSTTSEESTWKVDLIVAYPNVGGPAFESYRQGLFNNRVWLQKVDGSRFEHNGGLNDLGSDGGRLGFEYLFVDAPGKPSDYGLVYETPSKVVTIPLEFEFKGVPLP